MDAAGDHHGDERSDRHYSPGDVITYTVGECPGYLDRSAVLSEIAHACAQWSTAANISFEEVESDGQLDISWEDTSAANILPFGQPGGALAVAGRGYLHLDMSERWLLQGQQQPRMAHGSFALLPVVAHELGHVLGLSHSHLEEDLMSPYYKPSAKLSSNDTARVVKMYGPPGGAHKGTRAGQGNTMPAIDNEDATELQPQRAAASTNQAPPRPGNPFAGPGEPRSLQLDAVVGYEGSVPQGLIFHPDGRHLIYPLGSTVVIRDLASSHSQRFLHGHKDRISCVALSPSGRYLASGQVGKRTRMW